MQHVDVTKNVRTTARWGAERREAGLGAPARSRRHPSSALLLSLVAVLAFVGSGSAQNVMIRTDTCTGFDADRNGYFIEGRSMLLQTRSGTEVYQCTGRLPPEAALPDRTITYDYANTNGTMCELSLFDDRFGSTENWHLRVTPSGRVTLVCRPSGR